MRHLSPALALLLALSGALAAVVPARAAIPDCKLPETRPHPLDCRAFNREGNELDWQSLLARLADVQVLLLGEVHDNASHHRIRAQLVLTVAAARKDKARSAVVFEHIRSDQGLALAAFRALDRTSARDATALFSALGWERSGWPDQSLFAPLFQAALDLELPILPGNVTRDDIRTVAKDGLAALPAEERQRLGLDVSLPDAEQSSLLDELEASHCGLMPRAAFAGLADAQRYRDAFMARALADAFGTHGAAILLAGNGHVRGDRGVPWHLRRMLPEATRVTVLFLETEADKTQANDYVRPGGRLTPSDLVVLTPPTARDDPCIAMRKRFGKPAQ